MRERIGRQGRSWTLAGVEDTDRGRQTQSMRSTSSVSSIVGHAIHLFRTRHEPDNSKAARNVPGGLD